MVAIDLIVQHVHSQLEEVSRCAACVAWGNSTTVCLNVSLAGRKTGLGGGGGGGAGTSGPTTDIALRT